MSAISVFLAPRDEAIGLRIASALSRNGHEAHLICGRLDPSEAANDGDPSIVVWSNAALKLAKLHDQARSALASGGLIPIAIGGAPAPDGFESVPPIDLSGWQGDDGDPRWRFVLEEIRLAAERRKLAHQDFWVAADADDSGDHVQAGVNGAIRPATADDAAAEEPALVADRPEPVAGDLADDPTLLADGAGPAGGPSARPRRQGYQPATVLVAGFAVLCMATGGAIIFAPSLLSPDDRAGPSLRERGTVDLAFIQPAGSPAEPAAAPIEPAGGRGAETPLQVANPSTEQRVDQGEEATPAPAQRLAMAGPVDPQSGRQTGENPEQGSLAASEADAAAEDQDALPDPMAAGGAQTQSPEVGNDPLKNLLVSMPELKDQAQPMEYPGDFFTECVACPEMRGLEGGAFTMGSAPAEGDRPQERPQLSIRIDYQFAIGTREVTNEQWNACVADGGCAGYVPPRSRGRNGDLPVVGVSFEDAKAYTVWLSGKTGQSYRLPSEAEWEFAARANGAGAFSFGNGVSPADANYDARYPYRGPKGKPVGQPTAATTYPPNLFGLFDMPGNVWEWTSDCWRAGHAGAPTDGAARGGDCGRRVLKGGAYNTGGWRLRSAHRIGKTQTARETDIGFRVARKLD